MHSIASIVSQFESNDVNRVFYKKLVRNDVSKNQPYLGGSFDVISVLPLNEIKQDTRGTRANFKCPVSFYWLSTDGNLELAPRTQIILYPKYPEVRLSGFLQGCRSAPSRLMNPKSRAETPERLLFLGITRGRAIIAYVIESNESLLNELSQLQIINSYGVLNEIELNDNDEIIKNELISKIATLQNNWVPARYIGKDGTVFKKKIDNQSHGMTLEAEFGISHNAQPNPDWNGWELKAKKVSSMDTQHYSKEITLMTPQPDGGIYHDSFEEFIKSYGRYSKFKERYDFTGRHFYNKLHDTTNLLLRINKYNFNNQTFDTDGNIELIDNNNVPVASWSFLSLLKHWNNKHQKCAIIPCSTKDDPPEVTFYNKIEVGLGTDFTKFLSSFHNCQIKYDPACWREDQGENKHRNQWRISSKYLNSIYNTFDQIDVLNN